MGWLRFEIPRQQKPQESFIFQIPSQRNAEIIVFFQKVNLKRSMNQASQDFVVDLGDGQVWSQSVPNRI